MLDEFEGCEYRGGQVALPVAMLCFRAAGRLSASTKQEHRSRRRELLARGCNMLDEGKHWFLAIAETLVAIGRGSGATLGQTLVAIGRGSGATLGQDAASHLATAMAIAEAHSRVAAAPDTFPGAEVWYRARRKALECWAFLVKVHLAKGHVTAAHSALSNALRCALPAPRATPPPQATAWVEVSALRSLLGDILMRAAIGG
ncbi:hypothetical protein T484DRAFT_1795367 [Baffinella frigidus]|nr:hypothetical protein T484DRAFT_1795367 [Cryptophyta sp. CCMP2293]